MLVTGGHFNHSTVPRLFRSLLPFVTVTALALTGCSQIIPQEPVAAPNQATISAANEPPKSLPRQPVDPHAAPAPVTGGANVTGGADTANDRFAATVVTGVEQYWREEFPVQFGMRWRDLRGFTAADPRDTTNPPPCLSRSLDLADQALYCPRLDTVEWDRTQLVPELRASYGDGAVVVALSHEIGHAVQDRLGVNVAAQQREPARYPTILLEGMADCFAGVTVHAVAQGRIRGLRTNPVELDRALQGLLSFRDPVGLASAQGAHGNGFDRASAFIAGYDSGARACAGMTVADTTFTERSYRSLADASRGGNLSPGALLASLERDASAWFGNLATTRGHRWAGVRMLSGARCAAAGINGPAPVRSCPGDLAVSTSRDELAGVYQRFGDYASATVLVSRYALAALTALDRPAVGPDAGRTAVCLTGAYTGALFDHGSGFELSPGDLDEAVDELLSQDLAARDADGQAPGGDLGFDRVRQFRAGVLGGPASCGV
ncbi:MAG: neutral zinc metallopeptidase [Actinomycetota bacterium]|nr:neutral zinc metallopeptidase [Actinomycetota bacterium]